MDHKDGDGMFDSCGTSTPAQYVPPSIRYGNELIKVRQSLSPFPNDPRIEDTNSDSPRRFSFIGNRWVVLPDQAVATNLCYSLPSAGALKLDPTLEPTELQRRLDTLTWKTSPQWGPTNFVSIPHSETRGRTRDIKFRTIDGVPVEASIRGTRLLSWSYGRAITQQFAYGGPHNAYCSKLTVGSFEYTDRDGDGKFEAFFNSDANELIGIGDTSLVRRNLFSYRYGRLAYFFLVLLTALCVALARSRHFRKRPKPSLNVVDENG